MSKEQEVVLEGRYTAEELRQIADSLSPATSNKAAEEGELPEFRLIQKINGIAMSLAADLVQGSCYQFHGHDYLDRDYVCERVLQWRAEWDEISPEVNALAEKLRAADRATRAGASEDGRDAARYRWLSRGPWGHHTNPEIKEHLFTHINPDALGKAIDRAIAAPSPAKESK